MTKKKRRPITGDPETASLSDDLKGMRALKGSKSQLIVPTRILDRWISKAEQLERHCAYLKARIAKLEEKPPARSVTETNTCTDTKVSS